MTTNTPELLGNVERRLRWAVEDAAAELIAVELPDPDEDPKLNPLSLPAARQRMARARVGVASEVPPR